MGLPLKKLLFKNRKAAAFLIFGSAAFLCICLAWAATYTETYTTAGNYSTSDSLVAGVVGGVAKLLVRKPYHLHDSQTEFDSGTYSGTELAGDTGTNQTNIKLSDTGLVSYWALNGSTGSIANNATSGLGDNKGSNNGTASNPNGTGMAFAAGKFGNGVDFDGVDDKITSTTNIASLEPANTVTVSGWVKTTETGGIVNYLQTGGGPLSYMLGSLTGGGFFWQFEVQTTSGQTTLTRNANNDGQWHHVAGTYDGSIMRLYEDGVQIGSTAKTGTIVYSGTRRLTIGWTDGGASPYLTGSIDDVAVYNTALTASQIQAQYAAGVAVHMKPSVSLTPHAPKLSGNIPGLISYWPMDEASGTTNTLDAARMYKGTLSNMVNGDHVIGINGNALNFNGSNKSFDVSNLTFDDTNFTFSFWIKRADTGVEQGIFSTNTTWNTTNRWSLRLSSTDNVSAYKLSSNGVANSISSTATIADTATWHHVAVVKNGNGSNNLTIYVDGAASGTANGGSGIGMATNTARVGWFNIAGNQKYFNGNIDEGAIFNRALSASEIAYLAGKKGETATYTGPSMDGEITAATWDKFQTKLAGNKLSSVQFVARQSVDTDDTGAGAAFGDFDADGDLDIVRVAYGGGQGSTKTAVDLNNGDGTFANKVTLNTSDRSRTVATGDLDGDKDIDIVSSQDDNGTLNWWANDGTGAFGAPQTIEAVFPAPRHLRLGDIDGDGDLDVMAASAVSTTGEIAWWANNGSGGGWTKTSIASSLDNPQYTSLVDIDSDGDLDVLGTLVGTTFQSKWWENTANGSSWTLHALHSSVKEVAAGDLDGDGDIDLIMGPQSTTGAFVKASLQTSPGTFGTPANIGSGAGGSGRPQVALLDMDNDGDLDAVFNESTGISGWIPNNGNGTFGAETIWSTIGSVAPNTPFAYADVNGDGLLDMYDTWTDGGNIYLNTPWKTGTAVGAGDNVHGIISADLNNDGILDVVFRTAAAGTGIRWAAGNGSGGFGSPTNIETTYVTGEIAVADVDNDGDLDILTAGNGQILKYTNGPPGTFSAESVIDASFANADTIIATDVDKDGWVDIIAGSDTAGASTEFGWWKNDGAGGFGTKTSITSGVDSQANMAVGDVDADGDIDFVESEYGNQRLWKNTGTGFTTSTSFETVTSVEDFVLADLDGDGDLDIAGLPTPGGATRVSWWANTNGTGTFGSEQVVESTLGGTTREIKAADMNGDGIVDLVVAATVGIHVWPGRGAGSFGKKEKISNTAMSGMDVGDLNADGLLDLVAGGNAAGNGLFPILQQTHATVKFHMRTDTNSPPGSAFVGPDNTALTYFDSGAGILASMDSYRYGQYKAVFYRNDTALDPMIKNVKVDYTALTYSTLNPYVEPNASAAFNNLTAFTATENKPAGTAIQYILSPNNGTNWYYYNSGWVASNGTYAQSNTAATINTNIATFDNTAYTNGHMPTNSTGTLKYRVFLNSNGTNAPELDQLDVGYDAGTITVTAPNGSETWKIGSKKPITWTTTGTVAEDLTFEYSTDTNFVAPITSIATNIKSNHNEEAISGVVGAWHLDGGTSGSIANGTTAGFTDSTGASNGTANNANGTGMAWVSGKFSGAANFDGTDDFVNVPYNSAFDLTTTGTISAWINIDPSHSGINNNSFAVLRKNNGINDNSYAAYSMNILYLSSIYRISAVLGNFSGGNMSVSGNISITKGAWHHLAVTWDGTTVRTYVDGTPDVTGGQTVTPSTHNAPFQIGKNLNASGFYFKGSIDDVSLFNRALSASEIAGLASAAPMLVWGVPNDASTTVKVRARSASVPNIRDTSDANFTIADLNITAPNTAVVWKAGTSKSITWTPVGAASSLTDLVVEYSKDSGNTWNSIAGGTGLNATSGTPFAWTVPSFYQTTTRVRVRSAASTELVDMSDVNFTIADLNITSPNGGEYLKVGAVQNVFWDYAGAVPNDLTLEYTTNGSSYTSIATGLNSYGNAIDATPPDPVGISGAQAVWHFEGTTGAITNGTTAGLTDSKNANNGTASNVNGTGMAFAAGKYGNGVSLDGADDYISIPNNAALNATANITISMWIKRNNTGVFAVLYDASGYWVRLDNSNRLTIEAGTAVSSTSTLTDTSSWHHVAIVKSGSATGNITFYIDGVPAGTTSLASLGTPNSTKQIGVGFGGGGGAFNGNIDEFVFFDRALSPGEIAQLAGRGYAWTVPAGALSATTQLRIRSASATDLVDSSNVNFTVSDLNIVYPNGGEFLKVGSVKNIRWSPDGSVPNDLTLEYTTGGGYTSIATGLAALGNSIDTATDPATVSNVISVWHLDGATGSIANGATAGLNDVVATNNGSATNTNGTGMSFGAAKFSNGVTFDGVDDRISIPHSAALNFSDSAGAISLWIKPGVNVAPSSGNSSGILRKQPNNANPSIIGGYAMYLYNMGGTLSVRGEVAGTDTVTADGVSSGVISRDVWHHLAFTWDAQKVYLYLDGVKTSATRTRSLVFASNLPVTLGFCHAASVGDLTGKNFTGSMDEVAFINRTLTDGEVIQLAARGYAWTVPSGATSATTKVRIRSVSATNLNDLSDANFSVGDLNITAPNTALVWKAGTSKNITWTATGPVSGLSDLILEYSKDSGTVWNAVTGGTGQSGSGGTFAWTVPSDFQTTTRTRVRSSANTELVDMSDTNFTIADLNIVYPNGGEFLKVGSVKNIQWGSDGAVPNDLVLEYTIGGGYTSIATALNSNGNDIGVAPDPVGVANSLAVWHFDGSTGNIANSATAGLVDSKNANHGTASNANGTGMAFAAGKFGNAVTFDGVDDSVSTATTTNQAVYTLSAWIKPAFVTRNNVVQGVLVRPGAVGLRIGTSNRAVLTYTSGGSAVAGTTTLVAGTWYHLAGVVTASEAKLYVNGSQEGALSSITPGAFNGSFLIGSGDSGSDRFEGMIDEISFFNRALSSGEIAQLAARGYAWTVPAGAVSTTTKVRVRSASATELDDLSNANFSVGDLNITAPNGSDQWQVGLSKNITWSTNGTIPNDLTLEYSIDGGTNWVNPAIATGQNSTSGTPYSWTIPDNTSNNARVRVRSVSAPELIDQSDAVFKISKLNITSPNGSNNWPAGSAQTITWNRDALVTNVKLEYSSAGSGGPWTVVQENEGTANDGIVANDGTFNWTVPNAVSTQGRVRVTADDAGYTQITDMSDANFNFTGYYFTITDPTGSSVWPIQTNQTIKWTVTGTIPGGATATLYYSTDNGQNWTPVATGDQVDASTGATGVIWPVPNNAASAQAKIKIVDDPVWTDNAVDAESPTFNITAKLIVNSPNGGEKWAGGQQHNIDWTTTGTVNNVNIDYSTAGVNGPWTNIATSTPNSGTFPWTPAPSVANATIWIRVQNSADLTNNDVSDASFSVTAVAVTTPSNASLRYLAGSSQINLIKWTSTAVSNVKVEYSTAGSSGPWTTISSSTPAANGAAGITWNLPSRSTTTAFVRISDADAVPGANGADTGLTFDLSDNAFAIFGTLDVTAPDTNGLDWASGQPQTITWTITPANANVVPTVKITVTDFIDANNNQTIIASTNGQNVGAGSGSYSWTPNFTSTSVKIKVEDAADALSSNLASNFFSLSGLSITAPSGGQTWLVGSKQIVQFGYTGSVSNARLEYSNNGGTGYSLFTAGSIETSTNGTSWSNYANDGTSVPVGSNPFYIRWTIPDAISNTNQARVKVTNVANSAFAASSPFTITGALSMNTPSTLSVGQAATLTWTKTGTIGSVTVEFSPSGNFNGDEISVGTGLTGTSTGWTVTDNIGITGKLRVTDTVTGHPPTSSTSNAFAIKGAFGFTAPLGSTAWGVSENRNVTWDNTGTMNSVRLQYATNADNYASWTMIADNISNSGANGTQAWNNIADLVILGGNVPNPPAPLASPTNGVRSVKVRLTDLSHSGAAQAIVESSVFTVKQYLITFNVTNADGNNLANLTVSDSVNWDDQSATLTSPTQTKRHYKASSQTATFSKANFTASTVTFTADADKTVNVVLESEAPTPFEVNMSSAYNASTSMLNLNLSLTKAGNAVTSGSALTTATIEIFQIDGTTQAALLTLPNADGNGMYKFPAFDPATYGLTSGNSYLAKCVITYNGVAKTAMKTINFTSEANAQLLITRVGQSTDAAGDATLFGQVKQASVAAQASQVASQNVETKLGSSTDAPGASTLFGKEAAVLESLGIKTDGTNQQGEKNVQKRLADIEKRTHKPAGAVDQTIQVAPQEVATIRFKSDTGLAPSFDIYDPNNGILLKAQKMKEIGTTGVYEFDWTAPETLGDYTVVMQETTNGSVDSMTIQVERESRADESAILGAASQANVVSQQTAEKADEIKEQLSELMKKLTADGTGGGQGGPGAPFVTQEVKEGVAASQEQLQGLAKEQGIDLGELMDLTKEQQEALGEQGSEMKLMKNQIERIRALVTAIKLSVGAEKPIIQDWMEAGSVIIKVLAINPSKTEEQEVPIRTYLPVEVKPENIMNREELQINFDPNKSLFYVEKKVTLKPGETYALKVHIDDIWVIAQEELDRIRQRSGRAMEVLQAAPSKAVAQVIHDNINSSIDIIEKRQEDDDPELPQPHIATYRLNKQLLDEVMKDLDSLEAIVIKAGEASAAGAGTGAGSSQNDFLASVSITWRVILGVIGFLAILSMGAFMVWQRQLQHVLKEKEIDLLSPEERVEARNRLSNMAATDSKTGLYNMRHFRSIAEEQLKASQADATKEVSLIMIDLDHFKEINDTHGHLIGDEVLKGIVEILQKDPTKNRTICRYGGDEFLILAPISSVQAARIAENIRQEIKAKKFSFENASVDSLSTTASFGVVTYNRREALDELITRADKALYESKRDGRDKVFTVAPSNEPAAKHA